MRPIPQTVEAVREVARYTDDPGDTEILTSLQQIGDTVVELVPDCVGLSLCWIDDDVTFTLEATEEEIAVFDALQYLGSGPCVEAVARDEGIETDPAALMAETSWQLFAQTTAAYGIRSSLTFPLTDGGRTVGSINLYGASDRAFEGQHQSLADALGAWAPGAVRNADLSFESRRRAEGTPELIRRAHAVERATELLAERTGEGLETARRRLEQAALEAGVPLEALARALLRLEP